MFDETRDIFSVENEISISIFVHVVDRKSSLCQIWGKKSIFSIKTNKRFFFKSIMIFVFFLQSCRSHVMTIDNKQFDRSQRDKIDWSCLSVCTNIKHPQWQHMQMLFKISVTFNLPTTGTVQLNSQFKWAFVCFVNSLQQFLWQFFSRLAFCAQKQWNGNYILHTFQEDKYGFVQTFAICRVNQILNCFQR